MFSIQTLIVIAVVVGVAVAWTVALMIAGAIYQRGQARTAKALHPSQVEDARELVLR